MARLKRGVDGPPVEDARRHVLADGGAVLEAVPRAAADEPDVVASGWRSIRKSPFERVLVLADLAGDERRVLQRREPLGQRTRARWPASPRSTRRSPVSGSKARAVAVRRDLESLGPRCRGCRRSRPRSRSRREVPGARSACRPAAARSRRPPGAWGRCARRGDRGRPCRSQGPRANTNDRGAHRRPPVDNTICAQSAVGLGGHDGRACGLARRPWPPPPPPPGRSGAP